MIDVHALLCHSRESGNLLGAPEKEISAFAGMTNARLLLQVHDELVIEAPEAEAATLAPRIKQVMESAMQLSVPLTVEVGIGPHWGAAH
jgi:DNA polymerase-1